MDEVDPSKIIKTGIDAMLDNLDPYTQYVQESDIEDYKLKYVSTQYGGIGATIFSKDDKMFSQLVLLYKEDQRMLFENAL